MGMFELIYLARGRPRLIHYTRPYTYTCGLD